MLTFVTLALTATLALSQPTPWSKKVSIFVDEKLPASQLVDKAGVPMQVSVPLLQGNLQIELDDHTNVGFQLCLKQGVAAPAIAGTRSFDNPLYCDLFVFTNATSYGESVAFHTLDSRAVAAHLRGVGSGARDSASTVYGFSSSARSQSRRRVSDGEGYVQQKNVRAGDYFMTIAATSQQTANFTVKLTLSGLACAAAGQDPNNKCLPYHSVTAGDSMQAHLKAHGQVTRVLDTTASPIGVHTAALTLSANLLNATNTTADVFLRWGAPATADLFDAKVALDKEGDMSTQIVAPANAVWYLSVVAQNHTAGVNVTVTLDQCATGYGKDCANATMLGAPGDVSVHEAADASAQLLFAFNKTANVSSWMATVGDSVAVAAAALNAGAAAPKLFVRQGAIPTESEFDYVDCTVSECPKDQSTVIVSETDVANDALPWFVLVVPQDKGGVGVWDAEGGACAGNCSNEGNCTVATATCVCTGDFDSFNCSAKKGGLQRWEWALIIGGGVMVGIGLIFCIVMFIQRQQRRAGFERV